MNLDSELDIRSYGDGEHVPLAAAKKVQLEASDDHCDNAGKRD